MYPTRHAVERYRQRVAAVTTAQAFRQLATLAENARIRSTPRWWTPVAPAPGLSFAYPASMPGVCLLLRDGVILTVFERSQCREWRLATDTPIRRRDGRLTHYRRPPAGADLGDAA